MPGPVAHIKTFFSHHRRVRAMCLVATVVAVLAAVAYYVVKGPLERWLRDRCVTELAERLGTDVRIDKVSVSLAERRLSVYGLKVEDRRSQPMMTVDTMCAQVALMPLLDSRLVVRRLSLHGIAVDIYKVRQDTAANCQFVVDAFRSKTAADTEGRGEKSKWQVAVSRMSLERANVRWNVLSAPVKGGDTLDANHISVRDIRLETGKVEQRDDGTDLLLAGVQAMEVKSGMRLSADTLHYSVVKGDSVILNMSGIAWRHRDKRIGVAHIGMAQKARQLSMKHDMLVRIDTMTYVRNNGKPHKRTGKTHRGYFDPGHVNAVVNMQAVVNCVSKDSVIGSVSRLSLYDDASGLTVRDLTGDVALRHDTLMLDSLRIYLQRSAMSLGKVRALIGKGGGAAGFTLRVDPFRLRANIHLRDIAKPFAPVLSDFTTPLNLAVTVSGTLDKVNLDSVRVSDKNGRLALMAHGCLLDMLKKRDLRLRFNGIRLTAKSDIKETIIGHFSKKVRLKMVRQIRKIGDISYQGSMGVYYKRQAFNGTLYTNYGAADFDFTINGMSKEMTGSISTDSLELGKVMEVKGLGSIKGSATYGFSVASRRKRRARQNGRLPVGWMNAQVGSVTYKSIPFKNVSARISCDGTTAAGEVLVPKSLFDILVQFWYIQTDSTQQLRFKPRLLKNERKSSPLTYFKKWKADVKRMMERRKAGKAAKRDKTED